MKKQTEEEFFLELNRACAEVLKTVIQWNYYVIEHHFADITLDQEGSISRALMQQMKAHPIIKEAYNKYEWGK